MFIGTEGGGGGGGGCGESYALDVSSKWMNGDGEGLISAAESGGNCGVCVGVLGDESCAESGEEEVSRTGGWPLLGATDVAFESPRDLVFPCSSSAAKPSSLVFDVLTVVLIFEPLDFTDTLDLSSFSFFVLPDSEFLELIRDSVSSSSCNFDMRLGVAFFCWENSVSGGLGGLPSFAAFAAATGVTLSTNFDLCFSEPRSVDSGVYGSALSFTGDPKSSLLFTASLLCALLKLGYGRLLLEVAPRADAVRANSGTRSAIEVDGSDS